MRMRRAGATEGCGANTDRESRKRAQGQEEGRGGSISYGRMRKKNVFAAECPRQYVAPYRAVSPKQPQAGRSSDRNQRRTQARAGGGVLISCIS